MYELDESNTDNLKNHPAPHVPDWFNRKLREIGGVQLDGTPNLRVVWGQTERKFACGRERTKYPTTFWAEKADYQFRLRNIETNEITRCTYEAFMEVKKKYEATDPDITHFSEFKVVREIEWIGVPRFIVEQYMPSIMMKDGPANWELNRYGWWFNPETRKNEWTDINGPFPYNGRYEHFLTIKEDNGTRYGRYCPPSQATILSIQEGIRGREAHKPCDAQTETNRIIHEKEEKFALREDALKEEIHDALAPHLNRMYESQVKFYNSPLDKQKRSRKLAQSPLKTKGRIKNGGS
jgi:hypothetical protein